MRFLRFVAGVGVLSALLGAAVSTAAEEAPASAQPRIDDAQTIMGRACVACHDLGVLTQASHSAEDWPLILQRMVTNGANVSPEELKTIQDYLIATYAADH